MVLGSRDFGFGVSASRLQQFRGDPSSQESHWWVLFNIGASSDVHRGSGLVHRVPRCFS